MKGRAYPMLKSVKELDIMKKIVIVLLYILLIFGIVFGGFTLANAVNCCKMYTFIDSFAPLEYENRLVPEYDAEGVPYFVTDGDFKVMQLTDIHISGGVLAAEQDKKALQAVASMISAEKPDLVIVTGDIAFAVPWSGTVNNYRAHRMFIRLMERLGVYWTVTFGNHDSDIYNLLSKSQVADLYAKDDNKFCLFQRGPEEIDGYGNHVINVKNSQNLITRSLIMLDTNSYIPEDPLGIQWIYDNIHENQIEWYENTIKTLNSYNQSVISAMPEGEVGEDLSQFTTVKSLLFTHIPMTEMKNAWMEFLENGKKDTDDVKYLGGKMGKAYPYVNSPKYDDDMFETVLELGSTEAIFCGHDHDNNIVLEYKGVKLSYNYSVDYYAYPGIENMTQQRGCSIISFKDIDEATISHEQYIQNKYITP